MGRNHIKILFIAGAVALCMYPALEQVIKGMYLKPSPVIERIIIREQVIEVQAPEVDFLELSNKEQLKALYAY